MQLEFMKIHLNENPAAAADSLKATVEINIWDDKPASPMIDITMSFAPTDLDGPHLRERLKSEALGLLRNMDWSGLS